MRRLGWMTTAMIVCLCCIGMAASAAGGSNGFDGVVRAVNERYHVQGKGVPMMWAVSLVARGFTHGGVRGMRVVTYEHFPEGVDRGEIEGIVRTQLGSEWTPMVRSRSEGETSLVYVQPNGRWMRMVVVNVEGHELNAVRMEMDPEALARWEKDQGR
jgi:hypothetical protein